MRNKEEGINVVSLFGGMECGLIALKKAGIKVKNYYSSEIDKYAKKVSKAIDSNIIDIGNVIKVSYQDGILITENGDFEDEIDMVIGGSPCQGFSFAGKQLNFEDPRSKLFFEFERIMKEINPKYFLLENVKMKKEFQEVISKRLLVEPIEINSTLVSAQSRKRLYWTNIKGVIQPEDKNILLKDVLEDGSNQIGASRGRYLVDGKRQDGKMLTAGLTEQRLELRTDNKSNTLTTVQKDNYVVKKLFNTHPSGNGMNGWVYDTNGKAPCLTTNKGEGNKILTRKIIQLNTSKESHGQQPYQQNKFYSVDGIAPCLDTRSNQKNILDEDIVRKLTPRECGRLQTVPEDVLDIILNCGVSNSQLYKIFGNGWTVDVIAHIFSFIK